MVMAHRELHRSGRAGWLRAAVLGADDGIVSTASLVIGVAAAAASRNAVCRLAWQGWSPERGLDRALAATVAERLMAVDPLGSHVRDELGLQPGGLARPLQAAAVSAVSFAVGAALPPVLTVGAPIGVRVPVTALAALGLLALLGAVGERPGGAPAGRAALRVTVGGALAMA
jgi:VIT1/CCC1 family predicted Fe2+/Mn2+ transporter